MISVENWLKSFSFTRNPFETTEAGSEAYYATDFLNETFVNPQGFDETLGHPSHPKSSLVFAARGKGKTSARFMTAHFCREGIFPKEMNIKESRNGVTRVLPVHHTRFESLIDATSQSSLVNAHVIEILLRAVPAMVNMVIRYPELTDWINKLDLLHRLELQYFLVAFSNYVPLQEYKIARVILGDDIVTLNEAHTPIGFSFPASTQSKIGLSAQEIQSHLVAVSQMQPIDLLGRFTALMAELGFGAVYVLVDGVDEIPETSDNFIAAASLIIPLLANLNLMTNTPYLAFKIFVPSEMEPLLLEATGKVRRDRLAVQRIELHEDDLAEILHRRLAYCSDGVISSMDAISSVEMRGQMGGEMAFYAEGNPRHLVLLGQFMLEHRCRVAATDESHETYLLDKDDLNWALRKLGKEHKQTNITDTSILIQQDSSSHEIVLPASGDWFRHELPTPIALAYLVYQRESVAHIRIWKMYELVEACLAFLSQVLLASLYQNQDENTPLQLKRSGLRFERTSMGVWRTALEKLPGMLSGLGMRSSFARSSQRLLSKNGDFIRAINDARNRTAHDGPQSEKECQELLEAFDKPLQQFLAGLSFLRKSDLLKVLDVKKSGETYTHRCLLYMGDAFVFPTKEIILQKHLDSEHLWLLGDVGPVNLHPLMLVTSTEKLGEEIWLYQSAEKTTVTYKRYGTGQTVDIEEFLEPVKRIVG